MTKFEEIKNLWNSNSKFKIFEQSLLLNIDYGFWGILTFYQCNKTFYVHMKEYICIEWLNNILDKYLLLKTEYWGLIWEDNT